MKRTTAFILYLAILASLILPMNVFAATDTALLQIYGINDTDTSVYVDGKYAGEAPYISNVPLGSKIKLVSSGNGFMFYADRNNNTLAETAEYTFNMVSAVTVNVWNENTNEGKTFVYYRNTNDTKQVLAYSAYSDINKMNEHLALSAAKFGETFVSWDKTVDEIKALAEKGAKNIAVEPIYTASSEKVTIFASNGKVNGSDKAEVLIGSQVKLSAGRAELDKPFAYWMNSDGSIISDKAEFTAVVGYDETYYAVYLDRVPELSPSTFVKGTYSKELDKLLVYTAKFVPTGKSIEGNGILYIKDTEYDTARMTLENVGTDGLLHQAHTCTNASGTILNRVSCESFVYIRPYVIAEGGEVIYGEAQKLSKHGDIQILVDEDFDSLASISTSKLTSNAQINSTYAGGTALASFGGGKAAQTSGSGYIQYTDSAALTKSAKSIEMSMDIQLSSYPASDRTLISFVVDGSSYGIMMRLGTNGVLKDFEYKTIGTLSLNTTYNVKVTYDVETTIYEMYLDGVLVSTKTLGTSIKNASSIDYKFGNTGISGYYDNLYLAASNAEAERVDISTLTSYTGVHFDANTDKNPIEYAVGEDITFNFDLRNGAKGATCEQIKLTVIHDGDTAKKTVYLDATSGKASYTTKLTVAGFVLIDAVACDENGNTYSGSEEAHLGACADFDSITVKETKPADFEAFWSANVAELADIAPEILEMTEVTSNNSSYKTYHVKIKAVDDTYLYSDGETHNYVSGMLTVPKDASAGSCKLKVGYGGHGIYAMTPEYEANTITFSINAHAINANGSSSYYSSYNKGDLNGYGGMYTPGANSDRNEVYFKNMILRDLQALRFLTVYYGEGGEGGALWNGTDIMATGGSQGGFRTTAVTSLADELGITVSYAEILFPWLCDLGGTAHGRILGDFWPDYTYSEMAYYDTVFFGTGVNCKVYIRTGLGDTTTTPTGVTALYHALASADKTIVYEQNRDHGGKGIIYYPYTVTNAE